MKMDSEGKDDAAYRSLMSEMDMKPLTYEAATKDWDSNPNEWYHALVTIEDLPIVLAIPDLKAYAWCQCNLVANDGSEAHYHWHPLSKSKAWKLEVTSSMRQYYVFVVKEVV